MNTCLTAVFMLSSLFCIAIVPFTVDAQPASTRNDATRSSKGKDFYLTFMPNFHDQTSAVAANGRDSLFIFVTCDKPTSGRISYRTINGSARSQAFSLPDPTQIYTFAISYADVELQGFNAGGLGNPLSQLERVAPQFFRVEANDDVTVYALNQARFTSDAWLVLPVPALSREYCVMSYNSDASGLSFSEARPDRDTPSQFAVVATENNTEITVLPSVPTFPRASTEAQIRVLNRGDVYLVQADPRQLRGVGDLTGSRVLATKPVAVFGGHQRTVLPVQLRSTLSSRDCLVEQIPGVNTWGKSVFIVPHVQPSFQASAGSDLYRVLAAYDGTQVFRNGTALVTLSAGEHYEAPLTDVAWITASDQILVAQYKKSTNPVGGGVNQVGDPFMMIIPTAEQYDKSYRFINAQVTDLTLPTNQVFSEHYVTIVIPTSGTNAVFFDERLIPQSSFRPIVNSGYSFAGLQVNGGVHTARADSAFGIYVYGYGAANSYGYIGGGKLRVIAPDRDKPRIVRRAECFGVSGTVLDTLVTDSRIERVTLQPSTLANVRLSLDTFTPFADSVTFRAQLINRFADGNFTIEAKDSIGFITLQTLTVYGFTIGLQGQGSIGSAPAQNFTMPTGTTRSFPLVLTNYGLAPQTVSALRFASGTTSRFAVALQRQFPIVIAAGARDTVLVQFTATSDGTVQDTLIAIGTCATRSVAAVSVIAVSDRTPPTLTATPDVCTQVVAIEASELGTLQSGLVSLQASDLVNCTFRTDTVVAGIFPSFVTTRIRGTIRVQNPRNDAFYTITATDSSGNVRTVREIIPGFTVELIGTRATVGLFPETPISGTIACIEVQYRNIGVQPFVLNTFAPTGNRWFSIPVSQLPIVIPAGGQTSISICFAPVALRDYADTLIISRNCLADTVILRGSGSAPVRVVDTRCAAPIRLRTTSLESAFVLAPVSPNPVTDVATVRVTMQDAAHVAIMLTSATGAPLSTVYDGDLEKGSSDVMMDVNRLPSGVYMLVVQSGTKRAVQQIVVLR
jgi:hypothetical protein